MSAAPLVTIGAVCGLAWAASLRGFMAQVAGPDSSASWVGTFGWVLLPGLAAGLLLGWAEHLRRTGGGRGWRWLALAPLTFTLVLLPGLRDPAGLLAGGVGGGAIGVPVFGIAGGYALSRRGPAAGRIACAVLFLTMVPIWGLTVTTFGGTDLALSTPRGLWVAVYYWTLMGVLALACAIPHRPVVPCPGGRAATGPWPGSRRSRHTRLLRGGQDALEQEQGHRARATADTALGK